MVDRLLAAIGTIGQRLGLEEIRFTSEDLRRIAVLVVTCLLISVLAVDFARAPTDQLVEGDPAPRTVKAPFTFHYQDRVGYERARAQAASHVRPVFVYRADLGSELQTRVQQAFERGETELVALEQGADGGELPPEAVARLIEGFRETLGVHVPDENLAALVVDRFSDRAQQRTRDLLGRAMQAPILRDRENLPQDGRGVLLITLRDGERTERVVTDLAELKSPVEARQEVTLGVLESAGDARVLDASAAIARALVRANVSHAPLETEEARRQAEATVTLDVRTVKRGATLFRAGDPLTAEHLLLYKELQGQRGDTDIALEVLALTLLLLLLLISLHHFGSTHLQAFTNEVRDVAAVAALLALTAVIARMVVLSSEGIAAVIGYDAEARSVWFFVPVAGAAMLVRTLLGVGWTWLFAIAGSVICGLMMDLQVLPVLFFLISAVAGGSAVEHARERLNVLRAGVSVGVVNAVCVLLIHFVQLFVTEGEVSSAAAIRPLWSMSFAFLGGVASGFLVLGLTPLFELAGFVTDLRLMELANLNHPLLRELMLRAPGSYHHSVIVGTLAEAGCERIGANGLRAKVASYFHDIGKSKKPQYFVENQRDGVNRHDGLDPTTSARIIISHVTDGGQMAKEHGLPQPVIDNIYMHHGTGLLQYFLKEARARAKDPDDIDEATFRYPGPRPNTREAGVIMLADKVEAATRTLKNPDETNIRLMISRIVSSVIADGQFVECPLTLQEIHSVAETFAQVLVGIYHQRIEYADTRDVSRAVSHPPRGARPSDPPREAFITLDIVPSGPPTADRPARTPAPAAERPEAQTPAAASRADEETSDVVDYESLEFLPRGDE